MNCLYHRIDLGKSISLLKISWFDFLNPTDSDDEVAWTKIIDE